MSEFKGTPGPWQSLGDAEDGECRVRQTASVQDFGGFVSEKTICTDVRTDADGRLIAAAPELLEALQELRALMQGVIDGDYEPDSVTLQIADAAIAKATSHA